MKKTVLNGISLFGNENFGIRRYTQEILKELDSMLEPGELEIAVEKIDDTCVQYKNIKLVKLGSFVEGEKKKLLSATRWVNFELRDYVAKNNAVSFDSQLIFPFWGCDIIAIHDCIPELFPEMYDTRGKKLGRAFLLLRQKVATRKCKLLITPSEFSKKDIEKFYNLPADKISVIPNAWQHFERIAEDAEVLHRYGLEKGGFFFSLGSRSYHKNARWILAAAEKNPNELFVVTGAAPGGVDSEAESNTLKNVIFTGYLSDEEIKALMHYCKAFIQPSLYEGFGIPPMEAMSVGANCIVARAGSLPEVYKDSVWYIDPLDYENINLEEIMSRPKADNSLILEEYSWRKSAEKMLELLRTLSTK